MLDDALAEWASILDVDIGAAARVGVETAVRAALTRADRDTYTHYPEQTEDRWVEIESWDSS